MPETTIRRNTSPETLRKLWNCIDFIRKQKQIANIERISKFMQREHAFTQKQVLLALHKSVKDCMIVETISMGVKGAMAGVEQEGYWVPTYNAPQNAENDNNHDWYCFACHDSGKVCCCTTCFRVFHPHCIKEYNLHEEFQWKCKHCTNTSQNIGISRTDLNESFNFMLSRLYNRSSLVLNKPSKEACPYYDTFVFKHMDINQIIQMCSQYKFNTCSEFLAQLQLVEHNCYVVYGATHSTTVAVTEAIEQCKSDISELLLCQNCYRHSNIPSNKDWFSNPCDPPHKVVWAKQKGFDYWPAKLLQVSLDNNTADCRFFGSHHERAWVPIQNVCSIKTAPTLLNINRRTSGWNKAINEMKEYIRKCEFDLGKPTTESVVSFNSNALMSSKENKNKMQKVKQVVWAKKKSCESLGQSLYWPAKVIRTYYMDSTFDLEFFGDKEREVVPKTEVKFVDINPLYIGLKSVNFLWRKATEEAQNYINELTANANIPVGVGVGSGELQIRRQKRKLQRNENTKYMKRKRVETINVDDVYDDESEMTESNMIGDPIAEIMATIVGEKAKLEEECARSWKYGTELIKIGYLKLIPAQWFFSNKYKETRTKNIEVQMRLRTKKLGKRVPRDGNHTITSTSHKMESKCVSVGPDELDGDGDECSCKFRYEQMIFKYKDSLNQEHKDQFKCLQLAVAKQILKEREGHAAKLTQCSTEITKLKEENSKLLDELKLLKSNTQSNTSVQLVNGDDSG